MKLNKLGVYRQWLFKVQTDDTHGHKIEGGKAIAFVMYDKAA